MADSILLILLDDTLPVIRFISGSSIYHEFYLVLDLYEQTVPIRLSFDEFYGMAHQFHQAVVVRKFTLAVRDTPGKGCVLFDMPCNIDSSLYISVIVPVTDISLE